MTRAKKSGDMASYMYKDTDDAAEALKFYLSRWLP